VISEAASRGLTFAASIAASAPFPLLQVAKQGDRLIGNQDLPCFRA
jgi:hypothetical protein